MIFGNSSILVRQRAEVLTDLDLRSRRPMPVRLYQVRKYYAFALNALWYHLCDVGLALQGDFRAIPIAILIGQFLSALSLDALANRLGMERPEYTQDPTN
jgi:hypothetical protein